MSWPSRVSQEIQPKMTIDSKSRWRVSCWWCLPPALGQKWGERGVNVGSWLSAASQLYRPSGTADMRRGETAVMTRWGDEGYAVTVFIQRCTAYKLCDELGLCVCVRKHSFKPFSLRALSLCYVMLPQWRPVRNPYKKRRMPTSLHPEACQSSLKGEGPHNLLFVPLLLRKYFLNSSFSFVYFYCSYFLPWSNPVFSYLFAF